MALWLWLGIQAALALKKSVCAHEGRSLSLQRLQPGGLNGAFQTGRAGDPKLRKAGDATAFFKEILNR
jgi:hypothetical protein